MADLATLGLRVDASGYVTTVRQAKDETKQLGTSGAQAERQYAALGAQMQKVARDQQMVNQATGAGRSAYRELQRDVALANEHFASGRLSLEGYTTAMQHARREADRLGIGASGVGAAISKAELSIVTGTASQRALAQETARTTQATVAATGAVARSSAEVVKVGRAARTAGVGLGMMTESVASLFRQTVGVSPVVGQLAAALGRMALGTTLTVGVLGGLAAIGWAFKKLTSETRAAREENEKYVKSLLDAERQSVFASPGATQGRRDATRQQLEEAIARRDRYTAASGGGVDPLSLAFAGAAGLAQREVERLTDALRVQNQDVKEAITNAGMLGEVSSEWARETNTLTDALRRLRAELDNDAIFRVPKTMDMYVAMATGLSGRGVMPEQGEQARFRYTGYFKPPTVDYLRSTMPGASRRNSGELDVRSGANWGQAAQIAGGIVLGTGLAGDGYAAAGLGGGLSMAAQGAMLGSVVPGIGTAVGAVVGGVAGLVSGLFGHSKKVREEAERLKVAQRIFDRSLEARKAAAAGDEELATRLQLRAQHEKDIEEARQGRMSKASILALQAIQYEEKLNLVRDQAAAAAAEAARVEEERLAILERSARVQEDLMVQLARATGHDSIADRMAFAAQQRRELADADPNDRPLVELVQGFKKQAFELELWRRQQIEAIESAANAQLEALARQEETARQALQTNQEQLRAQERTVDTLRSVVDSLGRFGDSLKLGGLSPLTPQQQYAESLAQVEMLRNLALGGDATAAASLPDAIRTWLEQSRAMFGTATPQFSADFSAAQQMVEEIRSQYAGQLDVQERILNELQLQSHKLEAQLAELRSEQDTIRKAAADQVKAVNEIHAAEMARMWDMVRHLFDIRDTTGGTEDNTGKAYLTALGLNAAYESQVIPSLHSYYAGQLAAKDQAYGGQLAALVAAINGLREDLHPGWRGQSAPSAQSQSATLDDVVVAIEGMERRLGLELQNMEG